MDEGSSLYSYTHGSIVAVGLTFCEAGAKAAALVKSEAIKAIFMVTTSKTLEGCAWAGVGPRARKEIGSTDSRVIHCAARVP